MFWKSINSNFKILIARLIQTTGDYFAYFYFHILTFPFLTYFPISKYNILLYQRNIKEISKKYQRNIKEISKKQILIYRSKLFLHFNKIKISGICSLRQLSLEFVALLSRPLFTSLIEKFY
jgi:hypothetical protein